MNINKKLILILLIIVIGTIIYFTNFRKNIENFTNSEYSNNYIINGSFMDGKPILNSTLLGNSSIINFTNNPGNSDYVLENKSDEKTGINIDIKNLTKDNIYKFAFYYNSPNDFNIGNYIKFSVIDKNNQVKYLSQKLYKNETPLIIKDTKWYYVSSVITIPDYMDTDKNMTIQLFNTNKLVVSKVHSTDYKFYKVLENDEDYELTKDLKLLLLTQSYHTGNKKWMDYSGFHNDFYFAPNLPTINNDKNKPGVSIYNNKLIGPLCTDVFGYKSNEFSILFSFNLPNDDKVYYNENDINDNVHNEYSEEEMIIGEHTSEENINDYLFLTVPGNQDYLLKVYIKPEIGYISIYANDGKINMYRDNIIFNKSIMGISYKNDKLNLYQNGTNILSMDCNNAIFYPSSEKNIVINENKNINVLMNYFAIYNNALVSDDYNTIDDYFKGYYNPHNDKHIVIIDSEHDDEHKKTCNEACDNLCASVKYDENLYLKCRSNQCKELDKCKDYCKDNKEDPLCNDIDLSCPTVYIKNGNYFIYIPPTANFEYKTGELNYGSVRSKARRLFELNFPKCPLPDILKYPGGVHPAKKCPYLVNNEANPCNSPECQDIDWSVSPYKQNIDKQCKQKISNYCRLYHDIDPENCKCWTDKYKDTQVCHEHRRYFEDPNDYNCSIKTFKIDEHPDYNKYIKKDKIPCWNCDLSN